MMPHSENAIIGCVAERKESNITVQHLHGPRDILNTY